MSYLVLARKFRPQTFESIAGQEHITQALASAIVRRKVPHSFLFTGPRGVGKTTSARVLARALNCTGRALPEEGADIRSSDLRKLVEPCGECVNCMEIAKSSSMAVWEIDGASNNSVDNIRELIDSLRSLPPHGSEYKIYIIDEVHMLSVAAFNALLKSLEEPPPNTVFIFATTEPHKIPDTVISRCQRHDFRHLPVETIAKRLEEIATAEGIQVEDEVFYFVARRADGGMRDAQSMFDRLIAFGYEKLDLEHAQGIFGAVDREFFFRQSDAILSGDASRCFEQIEEAFARSIDLRTFVADFLSHWRVLMLLGASSDDRNANTDLRRLFEMRDEEFASYLEQVKRSTDFDLQRLFEIAYQTAEQCLRSTFPRFVLEAGLAKMASLPSLRSIPEILNKIDSMGGAGNHSGGAQAVAASAQPQRSPAPMKAIAHRKAPAQALSVESTGSSAPVAEKTEAKSSTATVSAEPEPEVSAATVEPDDDYLDEGSEFPDMASFNPSWQEFLTFLKNGREVRLEAYLRRVSPKSFISGSLVIEAERFDIESLQEAETMASLLRTLGVYSGHSSWRVSFVEHKKSEVGKDDSEQESVSNHIPGSAAANEIQELKKTNARIEKEAKASDGVKQLLRVFEGSSVLAVEPLNTQTMD
jgi:DNA polymerase-3 subunit gamma/tau